MDSNNDDSDDNSNTAMDYLRRPYDPSSTDMLTIRTSWIRTVHRAAQAYLHQMASSSTDEGVPTVSGVSKITEKDILYAYIWHFLTRARARGAEPTDHMKVAKLFTIVDVRDVLFPPSHTQNQCPSNSDSDSDSSTCFKNLLLSLPAIATIPLHSFFLRPAITDETGIPHLRRYALLARAIRSAIETVRARPGLLRQHEGQGQTMAAKRNWTESCEGGLCIVSLEEMRGLGYEGLYGRRVMTVETGSEMMSSSSEEEKTEMGVGIHTVYNSSTPTRGEYHAVVLPVSEGGRGDAKWRVQLHMHPLDRKYLRRWMEENPGEAAEIVPRVW